MQHSNPSSLYSPTQLSTSSLPPLKTYEKGQLTFSLFCSDPETKTPKFFSLSDSQSKWVIQIDVKQKRFTISSPIVDPKIYTFLPELNKDLAELLETPSWHIETIYFSFPDKKPDQMLVSALLKHIPNNIKSIGIGGHFPSNLLSQASHIKHLTLIDEKIASEALESFPPNIEIIFFPVTFKEEYERVILTMAPASILAIPSSTKINFYSRSERSLSTVRWEDEYVGTILKAIAESHTKNMVAYHNCTLLKTHVNQMRELIELGQANGGSSVTPTPSLPPYSTPGYTPLSENHVSSPTEKLSQNQLLEQKLNGLAKKESQKITGKKRRLEEQLKETEARLEETERELKERNTQVNQLIQILSTNTSNTVKSEESVKNTEKNIEKVRNKKKRRIEQIEETANHYLLQLHEKQKEGEEKHKELTDAQDKLAWFEGVFRKIQPSLSNLSQIFFSDLQRMSESTQSNQSQTNIALPDDITHLTHYTHYQTPTMTALEKYSLFPPTPKEPAPAPTPTPNFLTIDPTPLPEGIYDATLGMTINVKRTEEKTPANSVSTPYIHGLMTPTSSVPLSITPTPPARPLKTSIIPAHTLGSSSGNANPFPSQDTPGTAELNTPSIFAFYSSPQEDTNTEDTNTIEQMLLKDFKSYAPEDGQKKADANSNGADYSEKSEEVLAVTKRP